MTIEKLFQTFQRLISSNDSRVAGEVLQMVVDEMKNRFLIIPFGINEFMEIELSMILFYFQPKKKLGELHLTNGKVIKLKEWSDDAWSYIENNYDQFKCLQHGYLVNMDQIEAYDSDPSKNEIYFKNGTTKAITGMAIKNIVSKKQYNLRDLKDDKGVYAPSRNNGKNSFVNTFN